MPREQGTSLDWGACSLKMQCNANRSSYILWFFQRPNHHHHAKKWLGNDCITMSLLGYPAHIPLFPRHAAFSGAGCQVCQSSRVLPLHGGMCLLHAYCFIILRGGISQHSSAFAFDILLSRIYCLQDRCDLNRLCLVSTHSLSSLWVLCKISLSFFPASFNVWLMSENLIITECQ